MSVPLETVVDQIEGLIANEDAQPDPQPEPNAKQAEPETPEEPEQDEQAQQEPEAEESKEESAEESAEQQNETDDVIETLSELVDYLETDNDTIMNLKTKAKVKGEEIDVTLRDLVRSYQLDKVNSQKSQELSAERKRLETEFAEKQQAYQDQMVALKSLEDQLSQLVTQDNEINWAELREDDPVSYVRLKEEVRERKDALAEVKAAKELEQRQQQEQAYKQHLQLLESERGKLFEALPEWADEAVASKERAALQEYLANNGFSQEEVNNIIDHRAVILTRKAMMFDNLQKGKTVAKKKVKSLPKVQKPGAAQSKADVESSKRKALEAKFRKTGNIEDMAELLLEG